MVLKDNKVVLITINQKYLRALYNACNEVFYRNNNYEKKPYVGILITVNGSKYAIPLTSAKEKHKNLKNNSNGKMLVFVKANPSVMGIKDIWKMNHDGTAKHILSVLNIAKMIPIKDGCYSIININPDSSDTIEKAKYKSLLNKELQFCISNKTKIIKVCERIYHKQITTGKVYFSYCDFKKLEEIRDSFSNDNKCPL